MVATVGDLADPVITHTSKIRGAGLTSSHEEEKAVLLLALNKARAKCPTYLITMCSDRQSLLKPIQSGQHDTQYIRQRIDNRTYATIPIWTQGTKKYQARR